jgi:hypothetical protein
MVFLIKIQHYLDRIDFWPHVLIIYTRGRYLAGDLLPFLMLSNPSAIEIFSTGGFCINEAHTSASHFLFLWIRNFIQGRRAGAYHVDEVNAGFLLGFMRTRAWAARQATSAVVL